MTTEYSREYAQKLIELYLKEIDRGMSQIDYEFSDLEMDNLMIMDEIEEIKNNILNAYKLMREEIAMTELL